MTTNHKVILANKSPWSLDPVVIELQSCPAIRAQEIAELMIPARMRFLDSVTGTVIDESNKDYGANKHTCPTVPTLHDTDAR